MKNSPNLEIKVPPNLLRSSNSQQTLTNWVRDCVWTLLNSVSEFSTHYLLDGTRHGVGLSLGLGGFPATTEPIFREDAVGSAKGLWHHRAALGPAPHNQASAAWVGVGSGVPWLRCCLLRGEIRNKGNPGEAVMSEVFLTALFQTNRDVAHLVPGSLGNHQKPAVYAAGLPELSRNMAATVPLALESPFPWERRRLAQVSGTDWWKCFQDQPTQKQGPAWGGWPGS